MKSLTSSSLLSLFILILSIGATSGCGGDGNTVVQPSGGEPTAEETAEYQQEVDEMMSERD